MIMNQLVMNQPEFMKPGLAFSQIDPAPSAGPWPSVAEMASLDCGRAWCEVQQGQLAKAATQTNPRQFQSSHV